MRKARITIIVSCFIIAFSCNIRASDDFKKIGYIPFYKVGMVDDLDFEGLTHLNIAFANPDSYGNLHTKTYDYSPLVKKAHAHDVDVFISLAGGGLSSELSTLWETLMSPSNRSWYISKIAEYVLRNGLQGADMDLEWGDVNQYYSDFILEMRDTFDVYELGLTVALPAIKRFDPITDEALQAFDWINMMVYDARGPWNPDNPGPHASMDFALQAIDFWRGQGIPASKLVLGVPFYGYDFSDKDKVRSVHYSALVASRSTNAYVDQSGQVYYNGIRTILAKLKLAYGELGGIMMWELGQDATNAFSLWANIKRELFFYEFQKKKLLTAGLNKENVTSFDRILEIDLDRVSSGFARIIDMNGQITNEQSFSNTKKLNIKTSDVPNGVFVVEVIGTDSNQKYKAIKLDP